MFICDVANVFDLKFNFCSNKKSAGCTRTQHSLACSYYPITNQTYYFSAGEPAVVGQYGFW